MLAYLKVEDDKDGNKPKDYECVVCGAVLAHSDALLRMNGSNKHSFVNPSGLRCNFLTFVACKHVLVHEDLFMEHTWFPGFGWRFLICQGCGLHVGWKWDPVSVEGSSAGFYGLLLNTIRQAPT